MAKKTRSPAAESGGGIHNRKPAATLNPAALPIGDLTALLSKAGGREISAEKVREDLAAGAPANADGTLHLVHYAAWLAAQSD